MPERNTVLRAIHDIGLAAWFGGSMMGVTPDQETAAKADQYPVDVEAAQKQLSVVQWTVPALTGAVEVLNSLHGEQQRPSQQGAGIFRRLMPAVG